VEDNEEEVEDNEEEVEDNEEEVEDNDEMVDNVEEQFVDNEEEEVEDNKEIQFEKKKNIIKNNLEDTENQKNNLNNQIIEQSSEEEDNSELLVENIELDNLKNKKNINNTDKYKIDIYATDQGDPKFYSNYLANLPSTYKNVVCIKLSSFSIPKNNYNITPLNNNLNIIIEKNNYNLKIEEGYYNINSLLNFINNKLNEINKNIEINLDKENKIIFKNLKSNKFSIFNNKNSICKIFGFFKSKYEDQNKYISEKAYNLSSNNKVYLFLENIDHNNYFAQIDLNESDINRSTLYFDKPIKNLSGLNLKFKYSKDPKNNDYYHFNNKPHKLTFELLTKK